MHISTSILVKYALTGLASYSLHVSLLVLQVEYFFISPVMASFLAFIPVLALSYMLTAKIFLSMGDYKKQLGKYLVVVALSMVLNLITTHITVNLLKWYYLYAQILVFILVAVSNFLLNWLWVFADKLQSDRGNKE